MTAVEQVIHAPAQLGVVLKSVRRRQDLSQQELALKAGGISQARLSQLELQPGRLTLDRLLLIWPHSISNWWCGTERTTTIRLSGDGQAHTGACPSRMDEW